MPAAYLQTLQIDRRKLLKISGTLATLSLTGWAWAGNMQTQIPVVLAPPRREAVPEGMMSTIIKMVGVGRSGGNAVEYMIDHDVPGVEFICNDSAAQAPGRSTDPRIIQLGCNGDRTGKHADQEREAVVTAAAGDIRDAIGGADMLFIATGMDGATGAASVVARMAREMGIFTVAVVTTSPLAGRRAWWRRTCRIAAVASGWRRRRASLAHLRNSTPG